MQKSLRVRGSELHRACQPSRKNGLKGSIIALFHALSCVCQKYPRWWIGRWNLRLVKVGFSGHWYCLIQCQAGGQNKMCTLIYWAKLVPLLHINIDEGGGGGESFGGQPKDVCHVTHCFYYEQRWENVALNGLFAWTAPLIVSFSLFSFTHFICLFCFHKTQHFFMWLWIDVDL